MEKGDADRLIQMVQEEFKGDKALLEVDSGSLTVPLKRSVNATSHISHQTTDTDS